MQQTRHSQSCRQCKQVFEKLLQAAGGEVLPQHSLGLSTQLEDYRSSPVYLSLQSIYRALQQHRGFEVFTGRAQLRGVDYFLPKHRIAVEFDESQHFTAPRRLTLDLYPSEVPLGFGRDRWMDLCVKLNRKDNSPPYRDEQRAWLDVLRDFSSVFLGNKPTVRIYAGAEKWCVLEPTRAEHVEAFTRRYLTGLLD